MDPVPGWAGTASSGSVVLRRAVGARLRRLREAAGISREQAAFAIEASAPTISRMELGRMRFRERDVVDLLTHYYVVDPAEQVEFLALVRRANTDGWWRPYRDVMPPWFETYLSMEQDGSQIRTYAVQFLPELLQSDDYARAVISTGEGDASEIERRMELSRRRRERVTTSGGPRLWAVLDEAVLRRSVTHPDLRRRQLSHLVDLAGLPNVSLQIARFDRRASLAVGGSFSILRFPTCDLGDVVYLELLDSACYVDKPADVEKYQSAWNRMCATIESPRTSVQIIEAMRSE